MVKNPPAMQETQFNSWVGKIRWRRDRLPTPVFLVFPCGSVGKESAYNTGDHSSNSGSGRSAGEGIGYLLQYSWASLVAELIKNLPAAWETWGSISGLGRSPDEGKGYPLQYSDLENSMDCIVHRVAKNRTQLSDFHFQ